MQTIYLAIEIQLIPVFIITSYACAGQLAANKAGRDEGQYFSFKRRNSF